jgi:hypothetical protein
MSVFLVHSSSRVIKADKALSDHFKAEGPFGRVFGPSARELAHSLLE